MVHKGRRQKGFAKECSLFMPIFDQRFGKLDVVIHRGLLVHIRKGQGEVGLGSQPKLGFDYMVPRPSDAVPLQYDRCWRGHQ